MHFWVLSCFWGYSLAGSALRPYSSGGHTPNVIFKNDLHRSCSYSSWFGAHVVLHCGIASMALTGWASCSEPPEVHQNNMNKKNCDGDHFKTSHWVCVHLKNKASKLSQQGTSPRSSSAPKMHDTSQETPRTRTPPNQGHGCYATMKHQKSTKPT